MKEMKQTNEFIDYVMAFYGDGGLYDLKASRAEVIKAMNIRMVFKGIPFDGDTIDREMMRDIILAVRG